MRSTAILSNFDVQILPVIRRQTSTTAFAVAFSFLILVRPTMGFDDPPRTLDDEQLRTASAIEDETEAPAKTSSRRRSGGLVKEAPALLPEDAPDDGKSIETTAPHAASFQGITPGKSMLAEVIERLGEATETMEVDGNSVWSYEVGPFPRVEVMLADELVTGVVIHLPNQGTREQVAKELNLGRFRPVRIHDDKGQLLGEAYPERGLLFAFNTENAEQGTPKVGHVVLEPVSAEPFLLRAEEAVRTHFADSLSDLRIATEMDPENARAQWMRAKVESKCGRMEEAIAAANAAISLDSENLAYQVTAAEINFKAGKRRDSLKLTRDVLAKEDVPALEKTHAQVLLGKLLATGPNYDYKKAMEQTVAAIKEAAGQARATEGEVRRQWRTVLVDGELSLATVISHGRWEEKHNVVPQWLASAEKIAGQLVAEDGASRDIYLRIYRDMLFCLVVLDGKGDPSEMADAAIRLGRDLIAEAEDPAYRSYLEWQLGTCLVHAAQIEYAHGRFAESLHLANNADALMMDAAKGRRQAPETTFYLGRLHFLIGSVYAVDKRDHDTAVRWYEKSIPNLKKPAATAFSDEQGLVGEKLVSIGVSLWENGRRESAVSLTEEGVDLIQKAVDEGTMTKEALAVPFENLAEMHRALGNTEQAAQMASKAANAGKKR